MNEYEVAARGNTLILYIRKEVDHHLARKIRREVDDQMDKGDFVNLVMDFEGVPFMDSSGIGMVLGRQRKIHFLGGKIAVSGIGPGIQRIFSMSGLFQLVPQYGNVEDAVEALSRMVTG